MDPKITDSTAYTSSSPEAADIPAQQPDSRHEIRKYIGTGLRYAIPVGISVGLVVWLFHKVDFHEVVKTVKEGCDFFWIAVMMLLTTLSHMIRGVRWGMQLRATGVKRMPVVCEWVTIWGHMRSILCFPNSGRHGDVSL
ncbi:MAG: flippase-like domain-containing protein [Muribaculaceae bacterium]|nr:flippase-like domain-containing protein [Muribaculaceae bacterium]